MYGIYRSCSARIDTIIESDLGEGIEPRKGKWKK